MSNFLLEIRIALRYLFNRTEENFISLVSIFSFAGIMLGVATLIIVISVMNGFREKLIDNIIGVGGHISIVSYKDEIENYQKIVEDLKNQNLNIKKIVPMIQSQGLANLNNNNVGLMIFAIENLQDKEIVLNSLKDPEQNFIDNFSELKKIVVGSRFAESMNLRVGDYINLISSKSVSSVLGDIPRMKEYSFSETYTKNKIVTLIAENEDFKNRLLEASDIIFFIPKEMLNKDQRKIQNLLRKHL